MNLLNKATKLYQKANEKFVYYFLTLAFMLGNVSPVYAATASETLTSAQKLLSTAATAGGGLWAAWGLVQLGIGLKNHEGQSIQGAIWQILGGGVIVAAATIIGNLDMSMSV